MGPSESQTGESLTVLRFHEGSRTTLPLLITPASGDAPSSASATSSGLNPLPACSIELGLGTVPVPMLPVRIYIPDCGLASRWILAGKLPRLKVYGQSFYSPQQGFYDPPQLGSRTG